MHSLASSETGVTAAGDIRRFSRPQPGLFPPGPRRGHGDPHRAEDGTLAEPGEVGEAVIRSARSRRPLKTKPAIEAAQRRSVGPNDARVSFGDLGRLRKDGKLELQGARGAIEKLRGYTVGHTRSNVAEAPDKMPPVLNDKDLENPRLVAYVVAPGRHGADPAR